MLRHAGAAALLGLALLLLRLAPTAFALDAGDAAASVTAEGETSYYATLPEAWAAAQGKTATLTLLRSVEFTGSGGSDTLELNNAASDITLEMADGVSLHSDSSANRSVISVQNGSLTLASGTVSNAQTGSSTYPTYVIFLSGGQLTVGPEATVSGAYYAVYASKGAVHVAGTVSGGNTGVYLYPSSNSSSAIDCSISVTEGAALSGGDFGLRTEMYAGVNVSGGSITGGDQGLRVNGSIVELSGGEFSSVYYFSNEKTVDEFLKAGYSYRGSSDWIYDATVKVLAGPLRVERIPLTVTDPLSETVNLGTSVTLSVTATTVTPGAKVTYQWYMPDENELLPPSPIMGATAATMSTGSLNTAGVFRYYCIAICDGYQIQTATAVITVGNYAAYVDIGGQQSSYETLTAAWAAANNKTATIVLLGDCDLGSSYLTLSGGEVTLKGGRYTVTSASSKLLYIKEGATLHLESGNYTATKTGAYCADVYGTLDMSGGSLLATGTGGFALYAHGSSCTVSLSGGELSGVKYGLYAVSGSTVTVRNATVHGGNTGLYAKKGSTKVYDSTVTGGTAINAEGKLSDILPEGYVIRNRISDTGDWSWVYNNTASKLTGTAQFLPVPVRITAVVGENVNYEMEHYTGQTMSVTAVAHDPDAALTYQWYVNDEAISGAVNAAYQVPNDLSSLKYRYVCKVSCNGYVVSTEEIAVTVVDEQFVCVAPTATAAYGQKLSEVELLNPEGNTRGEWVWQSPNATVGTVGAQVHLATFQPARSEVFDPVYNVEITVDVKASMPELEFAADYDPDKDYDGTPIPTPTRRYVIIAGVTDGELSFTWYRGETASEENKLGAAPTDAGVYTLRAQISATENSAAAVDDLVVTISPRSFDATVLTTSTITYEGTARTPKVTVRDGSVLVAESEYTVTYSDNVDVGLATVTVTDVPGGNYIVEGSTTFHIVPRTLSIASVLAENKEYDGTTAVRILSIALSNVANDALGDPDDVAIDMGSGITADVALGSYDLHPNAGSYQKVLLPELTLTGSKAGNYILAQQPSESVKLAQAVLISKAKLEQTQLVNKKRVSTSYNYEYQWSLAELRPVIQEPMQYANPVCSIKEVQINADYYDAAKNQVHIDNSSILKVPVTLKADLVEPSEEILVGTITLTMTFRNYESIDYVWEIYAGKWITANIVGIEAAPAVSYDGQPHTGYVNTKGDTLGSWNAQRADDPNTPIEDNVPFRVLYTGTGDTVYNDPPTQPPHNAGTYLVTIEIAEHECNYIGIAYYDFTIEKVAASFTAPVAKTDLVYDRGVKQLIVPGSTKDGTMLYAIREKGMADEDLSFSKTIPTATQAGTYTVCYMVDGNANHSDSAIYDIEVTIAQAALQDFTLSVRSGLVYNGKDQVLVIASNAVSNGELRYSLDGTNYSTDVPTAKNAGEYTIYYQVVSTNPNFRSSPEKRITVSIEQRTLRIISTAAKNRPYDGTTRIDMSSVTMYPIVSGDDVHVDVEDLWGDLVLEAGQHPGVGEYGLAILSKDTLELLGESAPNYTLVQPNGNPVQLYARHQVTKAPLAEYETKKYILNYLESTYRWSAEELISAAIPEDIRSSNIPTITIENVYFYMDAYNDQGAWVENNALVVPIKCVNVSINETIAAITLRMEYENYESTVCVVSLETSNKEPVTITGVSSAGQVPYTGSGVVGYTGAPSSLYTGEYVVTYEGISGTSFERSAAQPTEVGAYRVYFTVPETSPYYLGELSLEFSIVKGTPVVTGIGSEETLTYTGEAMALLSGGTTSGGTLMYALQAPAEEGETAQAPGEADYTTEIPTATEIGEYVVWYKVVGDSSFNDLAPQSVSVAIRGRVVVTQPTGTTASTTVGTTTVDGAVVATVSTFAGQTVADQAAKNDSTAVEINVSTGGTEPEEMTVVLQAGAVDALAETTDVPVRINTPIADVTLTAAGVDALAETEGNVAVSLKSDADTVQVDISVDGETVTELPGGVTVSIPCPDATAGTVAILVAEDGSQTVIRSSAVVDGQLVATVDGSATITWADNSKEFEDIEESHWASDAVDFVSSHELMNGTGETTFSPESTMTRGMLAQIIYNLEGEPDASDADSFDDVSTDAWYYDAVTWATAEGVVLGYGDDTFGPEDSVTREQIAAVLYRYLGSPEIEEAALEFTDADEISAYARPAMCWAVEIGLFTGRGGGVLAPQDTATRAEIAILLQRLCEYAARS